MSQVFSIEEKKFILKTYYHRGHRNEDQTWTTSFADCARDFMLEFPNHAIEYTDFVQHMNRLVNLFDATGSVEKRKSTGRKTILNVERLDDIRDRLQISPQKSLRHLAQQTGLSRSTCHKAVRRELHYHPYKVSVVQQILPADHEKRVNFCRWFNAHQRADEILDLSFYTDEAWFHLTGYVNSQNYRTWSAVNPHIFRETNLHPVKVGVWAGISRRRIIGPIFFEGTINGERYKTQILETIINQMHDDELQRGYFQQDGATAHTTRGNLTYLAEFFEDRVISRDLWPPRSPDLTPPDFFLWGYLKNKIFRNRMHDIEELKNAITYEINQISAETLINVFENLKRRVDLCIAHDGAHFQHFM